MRTAWQQAAETQRDELLGELLIEAHFWDTSGGRDTLMEPEPTPRAKIAPGRRRLSVRFALTAAAEIAVAVVGSWLIVTSRYPDPHVSGAYEIEDGGPLERGAIVRAKSQPATVTLGGYCRLEPKPQTRICIGGKKRDEKVLLEQGKVACDVHRQIGRFSVETEVGTVFVKGTRFVVELSEQRGENKMITKRMMIRVLAGAVLVTGSWGTTELAAGQEQSLAARMLAASPFTPPKYAPTSRTTRRVSDRHRYTATSRTLRDRIFPFLTFELKQDSPEFC